MVGTSKMGEGHVGSFALIANNINKYVNKIMILKKTASDSKK
jgi:spore coat polysaccharide biosynthesis predicted glycosyltransferase SpsG